MSLPDILTRLFTIVVGNNFAIWKLEDFAYVQIIGLSKASLSNKCQVSCRGRGSIQSSQSGYSLHSASGWCGTRAIGCWLSSSINFRSYAANVCFLLDFYLLSSALLSCSQTSMFWSQNWDFFLPFFLLLLYILVQGQRSQKWSSIGHRPLGGWTSSFFFFFLYTFLLTDISSQYIFQTCYLIWH